MKKDCNDTTEENVRKRVMEIVDLWGIEDIERDDDIFESAE